MKCILIISAYLIIFVSPVTVFGDDLTLQYYLDYSNWNIEDNPQRPVEMEYQTESLGIAQLLRNSLKSTNILSGRVNVNLVIELPAASPTLSLQVGTIPSSWSLYLNNELLALSPVGWGHLIPIPSGKSELRLRWSIDVNSAFVHSDDLWEDWKIGSYDMMSNNERINLSFRWFQGGILLLTALLFFVLFIIRHKEKGAFYFAIFSFFMGWKLVSNQEVYLPPIAILFERISPIFFLLINHLVNFIPLVGIIYFLKTQFPNSWPRWAGRIVLSVWLLIVSIEITPFLLLGVGDIPTFYLIHNRTWSSILETYAALMVAFGLFLIIYGARFNKRRALLTILPIIPLSILVPVVNTMYHSHSGLLPSVWWGNATVLVILSQGGLLVHQFVHAITFMENYSNRMLILNRAYDRFVPRQYLEMLGRKDIAEVRLGDKTQTKMTLLVGDIKNFSALTDSMKPGEVMNYVNQLYYEIGPIIKQNGGYIERFMGHGFNALFPDISLGAVQAAMEIQNIILRINKERVWQDLQFSMGIHAGNVMLGCVGEPSRMDVTVIADAVNQAERMHHLSRIFGAAVVFSEVFVNEIHPDQYRPLGIFKVKGKRNPIAAYHLIEAEPPILKARYTKTKQLIEQALIDYKLGNFSECKTTFSNGFSENSDDGVCQYYLSRLKDIFHKTPVRWDGLEVIE
ncbi:adenylate/guanylate cyclase domain-containing protein [Spirochaeta cellobiosiphila]|uniref:adenylate/guanylate cyclase domain-containing protein n=1 Tax=Spirochaeta cellobiosiphila TaxID=504483 RepID=UPI0003F4D33C|nr:adenylate/guanylate cyclase domain-containing protein [Spirochaeta cellobiosiphila]